MSIAKAKEMPVKIRIPGRAPLVMDGDLSLPRDPRGVVLFAHGSGSSRLSSRNRFVAEKLLAGRFATLLIDLLTKEEELLDARTAHLRFDIRLLADRLISATDWLKQNRDTAGLSIGYFGASTGGGAALVAAAECSGMVAAVVSRGGRPDLAASALPHVRAPTLFIVGGADTAVIELNETAATQLRTIKRLEIIPGATHLFEESGALDQVAELALDWFAEFLPQARAVPQPPEPARPRLS